MPTIAVNKTQFLADIGTPNASELLLRNANDPSARRRAPARLTRTDGLFNPATDEFDELCFEYGLELDEDVS